MTATLLKLLGLLAAGYIALVGLMAASQTTLLFPRWAVAPEPPLPSGAEELRLARPDGVELVGLRLPAPEAEPGAPPILGFGGNAWNAADMALYLQRHLPGHEVVAFHFRGYGPSTGRPSATALAEDAVAIHDALFATRSAGGPPPLLAGFSIGSGPAAALAAARPVAGVLLVTPFESLTELARQHHPWAPVRLLLRHRMEVAEDLSASPAPVAIIAAERDGVVFPARTEALRAALDGTSPGLVFDRTLPAGHNDLYAHPAMGPTLAEAMERLRAEAQ